MTDTADLTESIFAATVALANAEERAAYIEQACKGDAALRARVEALLRAHDRAGHLLDQPVPGGPERTGAYTPNAKPGTVIAGRYKLLEAIGEGGMGTVWVAEQTQPVRRKVALKLIKPGMDSKSVLARFEAERQALAVMDHPNIAKVLDGGLTEWGRPFFVMEYVKGVPITEYCDTTRLSVPERLNLFVQVCQAVQHAHQKGILHRDLKPTNILVAPYDDKPVPKVIDFGLAKAMHHSLTERTLHTAHETMLGTPLYMSPEQARLNNLDVDTRSDIYSLGVLLYELLTGTTPLELQRCKEAAWEEIKRLVREEEPPRPSTRLSSSETLASVAAGRQIEPARLTKLVRGELDWIVMKSLEKDRTRRYETANGFALDVQRYLADEPVQACPPSAVYRLKKFMRRNKGPVLAVSLVLLALVVGVVGTTLGLFRAEQQRQIAEKNEQKAVAAAEAEKEAKQSAQAREAEANAVLEFIEKKVIAAARPEGQAGGLGWDVSLRRALQAALPLVDQSFAAQPLVEARLRRTLAVSFANLGEAKVAAVQAERARDLFAKYRGPDHPDTLASMSNLAGCYAGLGRDADALKLREETLALMKAKLGPDHPATLGSMNNLALSYIDCGKQGEALKLDEEALALKKAKLGPDHPATLGSMNNLALLYSGLGRHAEALKLGQETVALAKAKLGPGDRTTLESMDSLACIYHNRGQYGDAVKLYEETLALMKAKLGPDHPVTLETMQDLAGSYSALGRHGEAITLYEQTLALREPKLGPDHPDTLASMFMLARLLATSPDPKVRNASRAVALAKKAAELAPKGGHFWNILGVSLYRAGDHKAAVAALEKSMELRKGGDSFDWFFLAMAHWQLEDKEKARKWYDRAVEWMEKNKPDDAELHRFRQEAAEVLKIAEK